MFQSCSGCLTPLLRLEKFVIFLTQGHIQRSGFLILFMSRAEQWHGLSCTSSVRFWQAFKPVLITACHHFCFKAFSLHLCLSVLLSLLSPACLLSLLSLPVSSIHPSLRHSQRVTSSISSISRSTCLSFFFFSLPKCYYLISVGVSDIQIHQRFCFRCHFSISQMLCLLLMSSSPSPSPLCSSPVSNLSFVMLWWVSGQTIVAFDFYSIVCRVRKLNERTIINSLRIFLDLIYLSSPMQHYIDG